MCVRAILCDIGRGLSACICAHVQANPRLLPNLRSWLRIATQLCIRVYGRIRIYSYLLNLWQ